MAKKRRRKRDSPPYFENPYREIEQTRKNMEPGSFEPTKDTFSSIESTENFTEDKYEYYETKSRRRPSIEDKVNWTEWFKKNWINAILIPFVIFVAGFIMNSNSRLSVIETMYQNQEKDLDELKNQIDEIDENLGEIKSNQKVLRFRVEKSEKDLQKK